MAARMACLLIVAHGTLAHCFMRASCMAKPTPAMLRSAVPLRPMRPPVLMASERSAAPDVLEERSAAPDVLEELSSVVAGGGVVSRVSPTEEEIANLAKIFSVYDTSGARPPYSPNPSRAPSTAAHPSPRLPSLAFYCCTP